MRKHTCISIYLAKQPESVLEHQKRTWLLDHHFWLFSTIPIGHNLTIFEFTDPWKSLVYPICCLTFLYASIYFLFILDLFLVLLYELSSVFSGLLCLMLQVPFHSTNCILSLLQLDFIMLLFPVCLLSLFSTFSVLTLSF